MEWIHSLHLRGYIMENPFMDNEKFKNFKDKNNCIYAVIHYDWDYDHNKETFAIIGFEDYKTAFDTALKISEGGVWVYLINAIHNDVIMYLTGWCTKKF